MKTSISAGEAIYDILSSNEEVAGKVTRIFPVVTDGATLPYIAYRCAGMVQQPEKQGIGADTLRIEVACFTRKYNEGMELAEAVRSALDHAQWQKDGLSMRSCTLTNREEGWQDDAYLQNLTFNIKI